MFFTCRLKISAKCERFKSAHSNTDNRHAFYICRFCKAELPSPSERMQRIFQKLKTRQREEEECHG